MAKNTFLDFSTDPAENTDCGGIGIQGSNRVSNFDNAFRTLMAILRRDVPELINDTALITTGNGERVIYGVIRQNSENSGWYFINDASHSPVGFNPTITQTDSELTVTYDFVGSKVRTLVAVPDETFAARGLTVGASVGTSNSQIRFGLPLTGAVRLEDNTNTVTEIIADPAWKASQFSVTQSAGTIRLNHPAVYDSGIPPIVANVRGGGATPSMGVPSIGLIGAGNPATAFEIQYEIPVQGRVRWTTGTTFVVDTDCEGTFTATWNSGTNQLTVAHPEGPSATDLNVGMLGHRFVYDTQSTTGFAGKFRDSSNVVVSTLDSLAQISFARTASLTKRKTPTTRHWINFSRGYGLANPKYVWSTGGNIWLFGVIEKAT